MRTSNTVTIRGPIESVFRYAAEVERWPEILPHYRSVEVIEPGERERVVRMRCVREFGPVKWPCRWLARQEVHPEEHRILYRHLRGPAKGMFVEWALREGPEGVRTTIYHELRVGPPILGRIYSDLLVGPLFVHAIAGKTLATIKRLVEAVR